MVDIKFGKLIKITGGAVVFSVRGQRKGGGAKCCRGRSARECEMADGGLRYTVYTGADDSGQIQRISARDITPEEFAQRYIKKGMAVVLTDAMEAWPAFQSGSGRKWTIEWFKETYGHIKPGTGIDTAGSKEYMTLGDYLDKFDDYARLPKGTAIPYLRTWYFSDDIPELVDDFTPPPLFHSTDAFLRLPEDLRPPFRWLFFGPPGTESKMHVDIWETDAWLGMLEGEKTFTLYHPAHRKYLEVGDNVWPDLLSPPNVKKFPEQCNAVPAQTLLKAGEIIYIPRKWPHHAVAQSPSISLTLNFAPTVVKTAVMQHVVPYAKNRGRCQMLLGRNLRAADNLMQLCIHGGTIKYADFKNAMGEKKSNNPMGGALDAEDDDGAAQVDGQGGSDDGCAGSGDGKEAAAAATRQWSQLVGHGWAHAAAISVGGSGTGVESKKSREEAKDSSKEAPGERQALRVG